MRLQSKAFEEYNAILRADANNVEAMYALSVLSFDIGSPSQARQILVRLLQVNPNHQMARQHLHNIDQALAQMKKKTPKKHASAPNSLSLAAAASEPQQPVSQPVQQAKAAAPAVFTPTSALTTPTMATPAPPQTQVQTGSPQVHALSQSVSQSVSANTAKLPVAQVTPPVANPVLQTFLPQPKRLRRCISSSI